MLTTIYIRPIFYKEVINLNVPYIKVAIKYEYIIMVPSNINMSLSY